MLSQSDLVEQLRALGIRPGGMLLVHSSLRPIGPVEDRADGVIDALLEVLGPEGTVLMPTHTWEVVHERQPIFHVEKTPSHVGALTELFRRREGSVRSLHPTHSVAALGPQADELLAGHLDNASRVPPESPYGRLMRRGGQILLLGVNMTANTCIHGLEEETGCTKPKPDEPRGLFVIDPAGRLHPSPLCNYTDIGRRHYPGWVDLEHELEAEEVLRIGPTGNALSRCIDAQPMRDCLLPIFRDSPQRVFLNV